MSSFFFSSFACPASVATSSAACFRYGRSGFEGTGPSYFFADAARNAARSSGTTRQSIVKTCYTSRRRQSRRGRLKRAAKLHARLKKLARFGDPAMSVAQSEMRPGSRERTLTGENTESEPLQGLLWMLGSRGSRRIGGPAHRVRRTSPGLVRIFHL